MPYRIGDRLLIGEEICTVRYIGEIHQWPATTAFGVEWDNPNRGKNDGSLNGVRYFQAKEPHSGSFIRASKFEKEANIGIPLDHAFSQKYLCSESSDQDTHSTTIQGISLKTKLVLDRLAINNEPLSERGLNLILKYCCKVTHLDLSYNLLTDFSHICLFMSEFKSLQSVDLSRNIFTRGWEELEDFTFPQLKSLQIVGSQLDQKQIEILLRCFPHLETLDISWNHLSTLGEEGTEFPSTLKNLYASGNLLTNVPRGISGVGLESLNLSHNLLYAIKRPPSATLRELDLSYNKIQAWNVLDLLDEALPHLQSLRVNGNPIFSGEDEMLDFYSCLARFREIEVLNGSMLSSGTRREAELFFVSQVLNGRIEYNKHLERWSVLVKKYPRHEQKQIRDECWLDNVILKIHILDELTQESFSRTILSDYTVRYLKTILAQRLCIRRDAIQLFFNPTSDVLQEMSSEFRPINYYGISDNSTLYVRKKV